MMQTRYRTKLLQARVERNDERGAAIVLLSLSLLVLMVFAAFSVDIGTAYAQRRQNQGTVDTAAVAGGVRFLTTGSYVEAIQDVKARVADAMGGKISQADWDACTDPDHLPILSTTYSATDGSECISFGNDGETRALLMRVRLPDVSNATAFSGVIGINSLTSHASVQVTIGSPLGGAFPAFVYSGVPAGDIVCVLSGPSGHPTPCSGQASGQFGTFDPVYYEAGCISANSSPGQYWTAAPAMAKGVDHLLATFNPAFPLERRNGDPDCAVLAPNMLDNIQGNSGAVITTRGLIVGDGTGALRYDGRLAGGPYADGANGNLNLALMAGLPVDNAPLWAFMKSTLPANAPLQCQAAQQMPIKRDVAASQLVSLQNSYGLIVNGSVMYSTPERLMAGCLAVWTTAVGPIFTMDFAKSHRAVSVPRYIETVPNSDGWNHIRDFVPMFLAGEFKDVPNGSPQTIAADPMLTHWAGDPIPANGSLSNSWNKGNTNSLIAGSAGIYVPCGSLPGDLCRPTGDPGDNGFGGEVHGVTVSK